jgi:hypothetical protein
MSRLLSNTRPALNLIHAMFCAIVNINLFTLSAAIEQYQSVVDSVNPGVVPRSFLTESSTLHN